MKVNYDGLVKILYRKHKSIYSRSRIIELIESEGANYIDENVNYLGFGIWEVRG